jgi:broad specificity phosphatase PhoE
MAIYLIRHGETAGNRARVVQTPDIPLSDRGIAQARLLGERLREAGITRIVASDMARAHMTAEPIEEATGVPLELDPDLQERNFGDHRGTPYETLTEKGVEIFAPGHAPPNGETWEAFHARVDRAWESARRRAAEETGHLAVVTHGLVCHSITARLAELPGSLEPGSFGRDGPPIRFGNTSVSFLSGSGPGTWRFELFACTAHLEGAVADDGTALSGI